MFHLGSRVELNKDGKIVALNLSDLDLTELPREMAQLEFLEVLSLSGNRLGSLPAEIAQLTHLKDLDLSDNELRDLSPEIGRLKQLQSLSLSRNRVTALPPEIAELAKLHTLDLSENRLTQLVPDIGRLGNLEYLYLWDNNLTALPPEIGELANLLCLYLSGNHLTDLPSEIGRLTRLQELDVTSNHLSALPQEIVQLTDLQSLELDNNPLRTPPPEIIARGQSDIRDYLHDLAQGYATRYEAKLLIVGEGAAGKSSLLRALRGQPFVEGLATTHGIDVKPYSLPLPYQPGKYMTLNVWDFGGQQIYHTTHQFFMTKRSLYLLVWSTRTDVEQARVDHWLRKIQVLAPKAPVILVATHIDQRPADYNFRRFQEAYPQLVGQVGISNRDGTGIDDLRQLVAREAAKLPLMEQLWPKTWVAVESCLRDSTKYHISLAEYTATCVEKQVSDEIATTALGGYLHDLGKILYYQDDDALSDFVVLKPNWLSRAISRVLDDKPTRNNGGVLAHADFSRIWDTDESDKPYQRRLYPLFLRLMERYLISFKLEARSPDGNATHSLVPLLLPHDPPSKMPSWSAVLPNQPEINMVYRLHNLVPPGLMSWFIVLSHRYTQGLHWREGVRLQYRDHQAEVVLNPSKRELWLRVRGPAPSNFFNILQHTINDRILEYYFDGLKYKREVPCNCQGSNGPDSHCPYYHDYEGLVARMKRNRLTTECGHSFRQVSVPILLEGIHYSTDDRVAAKLAQTERALRGLAKGQKRILEITSQNRELLIQNGQMFEQLNRSFARLWNLQMASLNAECPNTFVLVPADMFRFSPKNVFSTAHTLYLLCQHPARPHAIEGDKGYPVPLAKKWWLDLAPWLKRLMDLLRYIPKGKAVADAYDEQFLQAVQTTVDIFDTILVEQGDLKSITDSERVSLARGRLEPFAAEGPALRALHSYLKKVDAEQRWGDLHRTPTNDGNILWLCHEHRELHAAY